MILRRTLLKSVAGTALALTMAGPAFAADGKIKVVATFSILGDMVSRIGGEHVDLTTLVGPNGDTHVFQPVPSDAKAVKEADVLVVNGLGFEGWLDRLVEAADFKGISVVATTGIEAIAFEEDDHHGEEDHADHKEDDHAGHKDDDHAGHKDGDHAGHKDDAHADHKEDDHADHKDDDHKDHAEHKDHDDHHGHDHGAFDPHAWHSLANAVIYADNIAAALSKADPANAATYDQNRAAFVAEIKALEAEVTSAFASLPEDGRTVVTPHDAFGYFAKAYGLTFVAPQGFSTESEASAADVARLIRQIRKENIKAVFVENVADTRLLKQIANETGANIGGLLYTGALSDKAGSAATYLDMIRHNTKTLIGALGS